MTERATELNDRGSRVNLTIREPFYYHREYEHDIKRAEESHSALDQCKRVALVALPFLSLYKPAGKPLSIVLGATRTISSISQMMEAIGSRDPNAIGRSVLEVAITSTALTCSILAHPLGMFVTTTYDIVLDITQLIHAVQKEDYKKAAEIGMQLMNNTIYLGCFFAGSLEWSIASIGCQIFLGLYNSCDEFKKRHYLEGCAHMVMAGVRGRQMYGQIQTLQYKRNIEKMIAAIKLQEKKSASNNTKTIAVATGAMTLAGVSGAQAKEALGDLNSANSEEVPPLLRAIKNGDFAAVKNLVQNGADINQISNTGSSGEFRKECPLTVAFQHPQIFKYLLDKGANVNIRLSHRQTPLHYLLKNYGNQNQTSYEALCLLLSKGAEVNAKDLYGRTPLHTGINLSAQIGMGLGKKILVTLLDHGANLHTQDEKGWKPLYRAYELGNIEILQELVKRGESLNEFSTSGMNALHYACHYISLPGRFELIKYLIENQKMDVNMPMWNGKVSGGHTPIMFALCSQSPLEDDFEILNYLLKAGANLNYQMTLNGRPWWRILEWARDVKIHKYIIDWLIENGAK